MNKKFLSAILFGALMVTSTGTFVSCKDYDDDIENLQSQIDKKASLEELTNKVSAMETSLAACKSECASNLASAKASLEAAIDAAEKEAAQAKIDAANAKKDAIADAETKIATLKNELNKAMTDLSDKTSADINDLKNKFEELEKSVAGLINGRLSGLVLNPELYWGGIEAIGVKSITYNELTLAKVSADADNSKDAPTVATALTEVTPLLTATYHMNPSTADLSELTVENFKFLVDDKKVVSRASELVPEITNFTTADGDLTVAAKFTEGAIADGTEAVTVLALEVTLDEEVAVTSDYAAVYSEKITGFKLDNAKTVDVDDHLYETAAEAIEAEPIAKVAWNEEINLAEYVETHYLVKQECVTWADKDLKAANFSYNYELVGYIEGENETSQSAHAALADSKLRPQMPENGKAQAWGDTKQSQATIGRMPLVRVSLIDNNSNKVVAVGYIKVEITATPGKNTVGAKATYTFDKAYTLSCSKETIKNMVAWYQIEEEILAQLGISKAEFHNNYELSLKDSERANLYDGTAEDAKLANLAGNEIAVRETVDEVTGQTTDVLEMAINANYAYEKFLAGAEELTAIIRYAKNTGKDALGNDTFDFVYVTLKWAPEPLNVNPVGEILDTDKIKQYWFADDNAEGGSGYNEIHVNVNVPGEDEVTTSNFDKDMLETFVDGDITISGVADVYKDFQELTTKLVFAKTQSTTPIVGVSGTTYYIVPNADGSWLRAYTSEENAKNLTDTGYEGIASINGSIIKYNATSYAKDILNAAGRDALDKNVTATVLVKEANECGKPLNELKNNQFDVKFLRPITVVQGEMDSFKDGVDVDAEGSKVAVNLAFTDWRGYAFKLDDTYNYYKHYGIESITVDKEEITTNVSGEWTKLPQGMKVDYKAATTIGEDNDFGTLTYINNNAEVGNFSIKVPFVVNYVWGQIKLVVEVKVEKTVG